jgi:hypothetical protein
LAAREPTAFQALPSTRLIPKLALSEDLRQRLKQIASEAYSRRHGDSKPEHIAVIMAPGKARRAAEFYVSEKEFESDLPTLRNALRDGDLRKSVERLSSNVVSDTLPPIAQMRQLFCYGDPTSNGLEDGSSKEIKHRYEREKIWDTRFSAKRLVEHLAQWKSLMDELHRRAGKGRTPITAERVFVSALATYWTRELGCSVAGTYAYSVEAKQGRDFVLFVEAAAEIIPDQYRPSTWDHAIRAIRSSRKPGR